LTGGRSVACGWIGAFGTAFLSHRNSFVMGAFFLGGHPAMHGCSDMLVTSAVRDTIATFNLAPRAINMMQKRVPRRHHTQGPDVPEPRTTLAYYSSAVTAMELTATLEIAFDSFPEELASKIGNAVSMVGGIPLFGPYSGILIGVGLAIKLISNLANALVDARPEFTETIRLLRISCARRSGSPSRIQGHFP